MKQTTISIVKSTVPVLEKHGQAITTRFYEMLFEQYPSLKNVFNQTNQKTGRQQMALANTVYAAAQYIDRLETLLPVVKQIAHKHRSIGVKAEHYPIVGEFLLKAIKDVLKEAATDEIMEAWKEAYGAIADVFISVEQELYEEAEEKGWKDYKKLMVHKKVKEAEDVYSFYLVSPDQKVLPAFLPGQYVSVRIPGQEYLSIRQYSLSGYPNQPYYKITVKKEKQMEDGVVSTYLHDQLKEGDLLEVSVPAGDFVLKENSKSVFISGGVGITPMMSMLHQALENNQEVTFIHSAKNEQFHAMKRELQSLSETYTFEQHVFYSQAQTDRHDENITYGRLTKKELAKYAGDKHAYYYVCGSSSFTQMVLEGLDEMGISQENIMYESFGPKMSMTPSA
ncbi:NO-inducible flavohemoprotein [Priestia aryabhattai]|uniref:NO-inducible flavohemoprotein n=1 Tax=Priestia aryabhattai TaxID=412384 RepID=UPI00211C6F28|nr:NO-inducible flavohemoprotein [Priestia aryabhattai]MCQ9283016.1 NO-inducible flavohemoprotein [Priestia aryabhattai]